MQQYSCIGVLQAHKGAALALTLTKDGAYCLTGGSDNNIRLWNPLKGTMVALYSGSHAYDVLDIAVSVDNSRIASCGKDRAIFIWDVSSTRTVGRLRYHSSRVNCIEFNSDCSVLLSGSFDRNVAAWDMRSSNRAPVQIINEFEDSVTGIVTNNYQIIASCVDGKLRTFDIRFGKCLIDYISHPITHVDLSHDNQCVLISCLDEKIRLLELRNGDFLSEYSGHVNNSLSISSCLSWDDSSVISGSEDGAIFVWDLVEANCLAKMIPESITSGSALKVACHPSTDLILACYLDGYLRMWTKTS